MAASVSVRIPNIDLHLRGHEYLTQLAHANRRNAFVYDAMIEYGLRMFYVGRVDEGRAMLTSLPVESRGQRELALFYLKEQEEKLAKKAQEEKH